MKRPKFLDRELSWLSFNYRVLQEAKDNDVPLIERLRFLAIFSSNLDEYFRVRVASIRALLDLKEKSQEDLKFSPELLLKEIHSTVLKQQQEFGGIYRNEILPRLNENNIFLVKETDLNETEKTFVRNYFYDNIIQYIQPILLVKNRIIPFLKNRCLYHAIKLVTKESHISREEGKRIKHHYAMVEIPTDYIPRFIKIPNTGKEHRFIFLDDVIRLCLPEIFPTHFIEEVYSIKLTRDAELYIEDEFGGDLLNKIRKSINKRSTGVPSRFLYDEQMPKEFLKFLKDTIKLSTDDLVPGGRYHNFNDFFSFPNPGVKELEYTPLPAIKLSHVESYKTIFEAIKVKDVFLNFPYHKYDYVVDFFEQAANDPDVTQILLTQYRVANQSRIVAALIKAAYNGKKVTAFVEVKARFDEESNLMWAEEMERAGVKVFYSFPGLKVHAKLALIKRKENGKSVSYAYLGTGNFNEKTAKIYTDFGLLTEDKRLTSEISRVFSFLTGNKINNSFKSLLVAQFNMRDELTRMINHEIDNANKGLKAHIILKLNSLEDKKMINRLYAASKAGVKVDIIVRGICCLNPGIKGLSENIKVISIIDRFLEHSRVYIFHNNGNELVYAASADWMKRNLSRRIEVAFPIFDEEAKNTLKDIISIQLSDNAKARKIVKNGELKYKTANDSKRIVSQVEIFNYLKKKV
ncbi:MAG: polyphosphate kinase 1 [Bacteroidetes bacterium]|nr:polyphosphate kinase 1 [Bacteroidota bacterium]